MSPPSANTALLQDTRAAEDVPLERLNDNLSIISWSNDPRKLREAMLQERANKRKELALEEFDRGVEDRLALETSPRDNVNKSLCLHTLPGPGGSRKTYAIVREAHRLAVQGQRVFIAQPTIDLIEKTLAEIESLSPRVDCKSIHSQRSGNVLGDVNHRLKKDEGGQITLVSHAALVKIHVLEGRGDIILYVDEVPAAEKCVVHNLSKTHRLLTDNIVVVPQGPIYGRVYPKDEDRLEQIARNKTADDLLKQISDTAWDLLSDTWEPYVNMEQYQKLLQGEARQIIFHCVLRPEVFQGYKKVILAGANLEDSPLYHLFLQQGVHFEVDKSLLSKLRYNSHERGDLVTIGYAFQGFGSKHKQTQRSVAGDSTTNHERVVDAAIKHFGDEEFLYMANKSVVSCPFGTKKATRLPNVPHGFNQYDNVHNVVVLSASNPTPAHFAFLKSRGLTAEQIRIGIQCSAAYQAVLRSSIRTQSEEPKKIIVPDFETADYLANLFPGCKLVQLDVGVPEAFKSKSPGKKLSNAEKVKRYKERKKENDIRILNELHALNQGPKWPYADREIGEMGESARSRHPGPKEGLLGRKVSPPKDFIFPIGKLRTATSGLAGSLFKDTFSSKPFAYLAYYSNEDFINTLAFFHKKKFIDKKEWHLSPAIFDPNKCEGTNRAFENIVHVRGIWLDFENGKLKPEEFPALFPHVRMVIFNSSYHTKENPRFRVFIPTSGVMSPEAYTKIWDQIALKIRDAGYSVGKLKKGCNLRSGLDTSKRTPTSIFHLPCPAQNPEESFFQDYKEERMVLDLADWIENSAFDLEASEFQHEEDVRSSERRDRDPEERHDQARVDAAVAEWRMTPKGKGNNAFFRLAVQLTKAGMRDWEIEAALADEARYAHSPSDRRRQIPSIMTSLGKLARAA